MDLSKLCASCRDLLARQQLPRHSGLVTRSHIHNHTIYLCTQCNAMLEQTETPCRWQLLPRPLPDWMPKQR